MSGNIAVPCKLGKKENSTWRLMPLFWERTWNRSACSVGVWRRSRSEGRCIPRLQKFTNSHCDIMDLFEYLVERLSKSEPEVFLVQAWFIWNQRKAVLYGRSFKEPSWLNKRDMDFLKDFKHQQLLQLSILTPASVRKKWQPPPHSVFKMNFDAAIFADQNCSGYGPIIWNENGEVMAAMWRGFGMQKGTWIFHWCWLLGAHHWREQRKCYEGSLFTTSESLLVGQYYRRC